MPKDNTLSLREQEILQLAAKGLTNREIAQTLSISPNTVKVHLRNIFEKTGVASRTEATLYGMKHGIVDVPGGEVVVQPDRFALHDVLHRYRWIWVAMLLLLVLLGVTFTTNILLPAPMPESIALAEVAVRWEELEPLPEPRAAMAMVDYDEKIYVIAGEGPEGVSGEVFCYNPEDDHWEQLSDKPTPVTDVEGIIIGEKIYIPGGRLAIGAPTNILEIYDPRADIWETGASLPKSISAYNLVDFEGQMYLFGGWDGEQATDDVYIYDPAEDTWRSGTPIPMPRKDAGAVVLKDKIVVLGGRSDNRVLKDARAYFPSRDSKGEYPWEAFEDLPTPRENFGIASISDIIYVIGGGLSQQDLEDAKVVIYTGKLWENFSFDSNYNFFYTQVVSSGSLLYILNTSKHILHTEVLIYRAFYFDVYFPMVP